MTAPPSERCPRCSDWCKTPGAGARRWSNVFIQAKNLHYGFDFCPALWDWLDDQAATSRVRSIEKVADELKAGADELSTWAAARPDFFARPDALVIASLQAVSA